MKYCVEYVAPAQRWCVCRIGCTCLSIYATVCMCECVCVCACVCVHSVVVMQLVCARDDK